jgi:hypothetical protein
MKRRKFLFSAALGALAPLPAQAHTPYRQWDIFRQRYLQILTSRTDLKGDDLGDQWVAVLRDKLPLSRALVSRARDMVRVASLLKTDQGKLAILSYADADAMFKGQPPFDEFAPMPLELMIDNGAYLLVARRDLPLHHGYLIVATLMEEAGALRIDMPPEGKFGMGVHAGAKSYMRGEKLEMPPAS